MISNHARRRGVGACAGFSLLEVLIAALILGLVAVPLFMSLQTGHQGTERIIEESLAASLGASLLEKLSQVPFSKLPLIPEEKADSELGKVFPAADKAYAPVIEPYPGEYRRLVTIESVAQRTDDPADPANSPWGNLKLIRVRVEWQPDYLSGKSTRSLVFQTLLTDDTEVW
jgi:prepilin-type N-terminal cleavage/methylation domain-containing protein